MEFATQQLGQRFYANGFFVHTFRQRAGRGAERNRAYQIRRTRPDPTLLGSAKYHGSDQRRLADIERADSRWSTNFMAAQRHQIARQRRDVDWNPAECLNGIDMEERSGT